MKRYIFSFDTNETKEEYMARCGTDHCCKCKQDVPTGWGSSYYGPEEFICVFCEELIEDARRDED